MTKNYIKRAVALLVLIMTIISINPFISYAHDSYFLQVLIDENTMQYQGNVVSDKASFFNKESKHIEATLGNFSNIKGWNGSTNISSYSSSEGNNDGTDAMIFTFPSHEVKKGKKNNATQKDVERAYEIRDNLIPGLNDALRIISGGSTKELSLDEMVSLSESLSQGSGLPNGWSISYSGDIATLTKGKEVYEFTYRIKKGYNDSSDILYDSAIKSDNTYITWQQLMHQGNYAYKIKEHTAIDANEYNKPGIMEQKIVEMFESLFNGLRNLLGLYNTNDLIFNEGIRGSQAWYMGAMSRDWMDKAVNFHVLFQGIAWSLISLAVVKQLMQKNFATINPSMRVSMIETIKDLFLTGFILANIYPIINMLLFFNLKLVDIFGASAVDFTNLSGINNYSNSLSGVVLQVFYLIVGIYLNFVYIIRAITLAILIASAPLFVVSIAFGGKWKQLFSTWLRELISNIFLQSFHAFTLSFFIGIQTSSRGIEGMVVAFALIPMTEFFRTLLMGQGGGMANSLGMASVTAGASMLAGTANKVGGGSNGHKNGEKSSNGKGSNGGMNGNSAGKSSEIPGANSSNRERKEHSTLSPSIDTTRKTFEAKEQNLGKGEDSIVLGKQNGKGGHIAEAIGNVGKATASGAFKGAVGVSKGALGAGVMMALGGSSSQAQKMGSNLIGSGASDVKSGVATAGAPAFNATKDFATKGVDNLSAKAKTKLGMNNVLGAEQLANGDMTVHRDKSMLANEGLSDAHMDSQGNAVLSYNRSRLDANNESNLNKIEDAYKNGDKQWLQEQGIERVSENNKNELMVAYNKQGQEKLGFTDIYSTGNRVVETKRSNQDVNTQMSFNVGSKPAPAPAPKTSPKESSIYGTNGKKIQFKPNIPDRENSTKTPMDYRPY